MERLDRDISLMCLPLLLAVLLACGGGVTTDFECAGRPPVVSGQLIRVHSTLPEDQEIIGSVHVDCTEHHGDDSGLWALLLDNTNCSIQEMKQALRERAASAGGTGLVGLDCDTDYDDSDTKEISCRADVYAPKTTPESPVHVVVSGCPAGARPETGSDAEVPPQEP